MHNDADIIKRIFRYIWADGLLPDEHEAWDTLMQELNITDANTAIFSEQTKQQLKDNTTEAIERGVFGVPGCIIDERLFWGVDATEMVVDYINKPHFFNNAEMQRIENLPVAASRK